MGKTKSTAKNGEKDLGRAFAKGLLQWNRQENSREMPWKGEADPYKIWLSEIILQQTRVEQGWKYYERFIQTFPTITDLAAAPDQAIFKLWEGLGYYSRCRNLIATARFIATERNGIFPDTYGEILALKGVGPYTAAAIASFAYNAPYAVLDGNVFRVLSRIYALEQPIDTTEGKKVFSQLAQEQLPEKQAAAYNQAIMDFGAVICKPVPNCSQCFFQEQCQAFLGNKQALLPIKSKKTQIRERWFHYIVLQYGNAVAIQHRTAKDIWQNLYQPLLIEADKKLNKNEVLLQLEHSYGIRPAQYEVISAAVNLTQKLSHQTIHFSFIHLEVKKKPQLEGFQWVVKNELERYPFPKTLQQFLSKN
ncbi:A/G-specific adenine glycosylase [Flavisolibacter tropicus]|uniref:Adenine DNA glycosylase n=1 Tax=Flavisolibacter tropicus TaxID=1492898 RepID=A0A172TZ24_9BACT|nr:A/G-specific adenine glycosylase [Flavisolibacter tropicus]ANE52043.1 adenine glycosylase [Flavisolibacter tropicus]